ncbi:hypothetical protein U1769_23135 [Sphingomonas sp. ZT3P38]|uniref:hypothetical protein n=1 Tax=Parasphingomonas zepuensis TaxID=3096161 RepID=UPI002FC9C2D9
MTFRCFLPAWIAAWAVAVFLPSALIAWLGLSPAAAAIGTGFDHFLATTWRVADDVGPAVKLMIGGLLLLCFLGLLRSPLSGPGRRLAGGVALGMAVMVATITLVPPDLSRGFAAALTGTRFDGATLPLYLLGGALAGAAFVLSVERCRSRP